MTQNGWRPGKPGRYYMRREKTETSVPFGEEYWRGVSDPDGIRRDLPAERLRHITDLEQELRFINTLNPGRILDVGCGLGFFLSGVDERWEKHGVELSEFAAEYARDWAEIHIGTLEEARFPKNHFDVVLCHHVIEHVEHPEGLLAEIFRVLKEGGNLVLGTPDFDSGCARRFGPKYRMLHDPTHINLFTHESILRFTRDRGYIIERVDFPFFDTQYFTEENLERLFDTEQISPPFYGNLMVLYCRKPDGGALTTLLQRVGSFSSDEMHDVDKQATAAVQRVVEAVEESGRLWVSGDPRLRPFFESLYGLTDPIGRVRWCGEPERLESHDALVFLSGCGLLNHRGQKSELLRGATPAKLVVICDESEIDRFPGSSVRIGLPAAFESSIGALYFAVLGALLDSVKNRLLRSSEIEVDL